MGNAEWVDASARNKKEEQMPEQHHALCIQRKHPDDMRYSPCICPELRAAVEAERADRREWAKEFTRDCVHAVEEAIRTQKLPKRGVQ